jgi:hypothetical protein
MAEDEKKIDIELQPAEVPFACPDCGAQCVLHPRAQPMNAQHSLPACKAWNELGTPEQVKSGEKQETTADYLRRAKLPVLGGGAFLS